MKRLKTYLALVACTAGLLLAACSTIDDDLSNCGHNFELNYQLRLITSLRTQISTDIDANVAEALLNRLQNIFRRYAHDVDLSFYDAAGSMPRLHHESHIMNSGEDSYTIYLPVQEYMHLAVANIEEDSKVNLAGDELGGSAKLLQVEGDTIDSHDTGLFTARLPMKVVEGIDQTFDVHLYMANCAVALDLDPRGVAYQDIRMVTTGFANSFSLRDSTYTFPTKNVIVRADRLNVQGTHECLCSVNFPSPNPDGITRAASGARWEIHVYVTMPDGKVTATRLGIPDPVLAGEVQILTAHLNDDGSVQPFDVNVGVSVTLDWNQGNDFPDIPLG